jgi:hypothetical protein
MLRTGKNTDKGSVAFLSEIWKKLLCEKNSHKIKRVKDYNTKKNHFHTNVVITQNFFEH